MREDTVAALVERLAAYERVVEVGVGRRAAVAAGLAAAGVDVVATDVVPRDVPADVTFVVDDVTDPDPATFADAGAVYGINLPPELHRPARDAAAARGADFLFTTLGGEGPAVPVARETIPGDTLFRAAPASDPGG